MPESFRSLPFPWALAPLVIHVIADPYYIINRTQAVKIDGNTSLFNNLTVGVPQGAFLVSNVSYYNSKL